MFDDAIDRAAAVKQFAQPNVNILRIVTHDLLEDLESNTSAHASREN